MALMVHLHKSARFWIPRLPGVAEVWSGVPYPRLHFDHEVRGLRQPVVLPLHVTVIQQNPGVLRQPFLFFEFLKKTTTDLVGKGLPGETQTRYSKVPADTRPSAIFAATRNVRGSFPMKRFLSRKYRLLR